MAAFTISPTLSGSGWTGSAMRTRSYSSATDGVAPPPVTNPDSGSANESCGRGACVPSLSNKGASPVALIVTTSLQNVVSCQGNGWNRLHIHPTEQIRYWHGSTLRHSALRHTSSKPGSTCLDALPKPGRHHAMARLHEDQLTPRLAMAQRAQHVPTEIMVNDQHGMLGIL